MIPSNHQQLVLEQATTSDAPRTARLARPKSRTARRGSALVEFAFIALAFYLLLAGTIEIGRMIYSSQLITNAARVGARELAMLPLPATMTFEQALVDHDVTNTIYDEGLLALDVTDMDEIQLANQLASWPVVNRMLAPLMIRERVVTSVGTFDLLHYPGALLLNDEYNQSGTTPPFQSNRFKVAIPRVTSRNSDGVETIEWLPVLEEVVPDSNPSTAPFSMASTNANVALRGMVALRINYPFQAATLTAFQQVGTVVNQEVLAQDDSVVVDPQSAPQPGGDAGITGAPDVASYSGKYGLGKLHALGKEVRPFRRLLSAQGMFRREVFSKPHPTPP